MISKKILDIQKQIDYLEEKIKSGNSSKADQMELDGLYQILDKERNRK